MSKKIKITPALFLLSLILIFGNSIFSLYGYVSMKYLFIGGGHLILGMLYLYHAGTAGLEHFMKSFIALAVFVPFITLSYFRGHFVFDIVNAYLFTSAVLFLLTGIVFQGKYLEFTDTKTELLISLFYVILLLLCLFRINQISVYDVSRNFDNYGLHPVGVAISFGFLCQVAVFKAIHGQRWTRLVWILAALEAFLIVFSTGSRGASVSLVLLNFLLLFKYLGSLRIITSFAVLASVCALIVYFGYDYLSQIPFFDRIVLAIERAKLTFASVEFGYIDLSGRLDIWSYYSRSVGDWMLLGEKGYIPYPHNSILEMFVRFGLLGVLPFLVLLFTLARAVVGLLSRNLVTVFIAQLFILDFLISLVNGSLEIHRLMFLGVGYFVATSFSRSANYQKRPRLL
jgi:hypothetical protein